MYLRWILMATVCVMLTATTAPPSAVASGDRRARKQLLVVTVTKGFRHDSIPVAEETIRMLGQRTGAWDTDFVRTDADMKEKMTRQALKRYAAVVFANTTGDLPLPDYQGFLDYVRSGHGFAAMHSGSDTFHTWPPTPNTPVSAYVELLGAEFRVHHSQCAVTAHIADPRFPATAPLVAAGAGRDPAELAGVDVSHGSVAADHLWRVFDEIYLFKNIQRSRLHVLLSLDKHPDDGSPEANRAGEYLISWSKSYGRGRVFYTSLGHRQEMWHDALYQAHIEGGIRFVLGLARGSTSPTAVPAPHA